MGVGRAEQQARAGRSGQQATVSPPEACQDITDYCPVTIIHGRHRLDLALPTAVPSSELMPQLLRLMIPAEQAAEPLDEPRVWGLSTVDGRPLEGSETLSTAGVLAGDLLILEQRSANHRPTETVVTVRDRIEDVVNGSGRFWGPGSVRGFAHWAAVVTAAVLLIPTTNRPAGYPTAVMASTVAILVAMTAVLSDRRSEKACAAVGVVVGCGWAAVAGANAVQGWSWSSGQMSPAEGPVALVVAVGAALLLAVCAALGYPTALVHSTALAVVVLSAAVFAAAVSVGAAMVDTACVAAVVAVLALGGLPRLALACGGLTGVDRSREAAEIDHRITKADRVLLGCLIGVSLVAAGGAIPAALAGAPHSRLVALGIGLLLLLRSRAYSRTPHVLPLRIGGALVLAALWLGLYRGDSTLQPVLIIAAAGGTAAATVLIAVLDRAASPVGDARSGRILDLAEQVLVVSLIVLTAGVVVLFDWMSSVIA